MHYYVDGYNLIFRLLRAGNDLRQQREELIGDLYEKAHFLKLDITIVFDSQYNIGESTRFHKQDLEILFTNEGETADDYILTELKAEPDPRQHTVVTSDKRLAWRARRFVANTETVEEFVTWLEKRCRNKRRQLQENAKPLEEQVKERIESLKPKETAPGVTALESFDYYLEQFKGEIKEEEGVVEKKELIQTEEPEEGESELERWERLFQKKPKKKNGA